MNKKLFDYIIIYRKNYGHSMFFSEIKAENAEQAFGISVRQLVGLNSEEEFESINMFVAKNDKKREYFGFDDKGYLYGHDPDVSKNKNIYKLYLNGVNK